MKTLEELKVNRAKNLNRNYEIPEEILVEAEEAYESGRQSYRYFLGKGIDYKEHELWWGRCCKFVHIPFVTAEENGWFITLSFIED
jgi:hypothetical protein